jgi:hypothetical protein
MRHRRHRRPRHRTIVGWPEGQPAPEEVADRATYVGSAEHKSYPSPLGHPALRTDATRCDPSLGYDQERFTGVLREAIRRGCVGGIFEGEFPKYAWGWLAGELYEARHINGPQGTYKAYALEPVEMPLDPEHRLNWEQADA